MQTSLFGILATLALLNSASCAAGANPCDDAASLAQLGPSSESVPVGRNLFFSFVTSNGLEYIVADNWDGTTATIVRFAVGLNGVACLSAPTHFATGVDVSRDVMSPSIVNIDGRNWLYFLAGPSDELGVETFRVVFDSVAPARPEPVSLPSRIGLRSWPRFYSLGNGLVGVAYRDTSSTARFASSKNGHTFSHSVAVHPKSAMTALGAFGSGDLAYSYQTGTGSRMSSWLRFFATSTREWSEPVEVEDLSDNVHDTSLFRRADGQLDLYFLKPNRSGTGFAVWRRCLTSSRQLGARELVLDHPGRSFTKPYAFRDASGDIGLAVSEMTQGSNLLLYQLATEAKCAN